MCRVLEGSVTNLTAGHPSPWEFQLHRYRQRAVKGTNAPSLVFISLDIINSGPFRTEVVLSIAFIAPFSESEC
jgi:hypothetical protein